MAGNALVAAPVDLSTPLAGTFLLEDCESIARGIREGDWVEGGLGAFAAVADGVATVVDPLGSAIGAGVGWLLEHMEPIKGWFNDLTGDAGEVMGFAGTWENIAQQMQGASDELTRILGDLDAQQGLMIDTYRRFQGECAAHAAAAGRLASAVGKGMQIASMIVKAVHDLTRDALSQLIGTAISAVATAACTLGFGTPWAVAQVVSRASSLAAKVGKFVTNLLKAMKRLMPLLDDAARLLRSLRTAFDNALQGASAAVRSAFRGADTTPGAVPPGVTRYANDGEAIADLIRTGRWRDPGTVADFIRQGAWGFHLYGDEALRYLRARNPTLGLKAPPGEEAKPFFMAPFEDLAHIKSHDDAVLHTGAAASVKSAVEEGRGVIGVAVPLDGMQPRVPTFKDAAGNKNYLPGGYTALKHDGVVDVTPTREFVVEGGVPVPPGSILFELMPDGEVVVLHVYD